MIQETENSRLEAYKFLDLNEQRQYREFFENIAAQISYIADADLRVKTRADFELIAGIKRDNLEGNLPFEDGLDQLLTIIAGGPQHSLFAKAVATTSYCDLIANQEEVGAETITKYLDSFEEAIKTEPEPYGSIILSGAFWARLLMHTASSAGGTEKLQSLDEALKFKVHSKEEEIRKLGIHVSARVITELMSGPYLKINLPAVAIAQGGGESAEKKEATYPDMTMHLGKGLLASYEKLEQAAIWGMPDASDVILTRRLPRALVGIEVSRPSRDTQVKGKVSRVSRKNLIHTSLRPVRMQTTSSLSALTEGQNPDSEKTQVHPSFDSMSYWLSVRVSRELISRFEDMDSELSFKGDKVADKEARKMKVVEAVIAKHINYLDRPIAVLPSGGKISVIGEATKEFSRTNTELQMTEEDVKKHLIIQVNHLALKIGEDGLEVRKPEEIEQMYIENVWGRELSDEDRVELAVELLKDSEHLVRYIPGEWQSDIQKVVRQGQPIDSETALVLMDFANTHVRSRLKLRFETIRNKEEPSNLFEKIASKYIV